MLKIGAQLELNVCPHCGVNTPNLPLHTQLDTKNAEKTKKMTWGVYICKRCGGVVTALAEKMGSEVISYFPAAPEVDEALPERAKVYLYQAFQSIHAPAGAVMLVASAVDAMLKEKGLVSGSLYSRIDLAERDGIITKDMAVWAHEVRLDANDQRHADQDAPLPTLEDAKRAIDFAAAIGQFLFVLPARIKKGLQSSLS
ncbi:MAG: DUF4145 domain-containing protein [Alcanivorax sp.]|uniref:DUF4145 domain-containing protein n=1 Tax=Alcanivorax sp. TaxID=1872427 RepID=UPI003DA6F1F9